MLQLVSLMMLIYSYFLIRTNLPNLPARIPTHFNAAGVADGWGSPDTLWVLLGAQACTIGYGQRDNPTKYRWNEELFDHKRRMEVSAWAIWGMKKVQFGTPGGTVDFGSVAISTYAAAHT